VHCGCAALGSARDRSGEQISKPGPRYIPSERINDATFSLRKRRMITAEITNDASEEISSAIATGIFNVWCTRSNAVGGKATECGEAWIRPSLHATVLVSLKASRMLRTALPINARVALFSLNGRVVAMNSKHAQIQ
jgi:hypothetical protein